MTYDIGLIGLAVMGRNLVLNISDHGVSVAVSNRTFEKTYAFYHFHLMDTTFLGRPHRPLDVSPYR